MVNVGLTEHVYFDSVEQASSLFVKFFYLRQTGCHRNRNRQDATETETGRMPQKQKQAGCLFHKYSTKMV
jgi:hypothetical protein